MEKIGNCKICGQGELKIVKDKLSDKIYIYCDECEVEYNHPEDALNNCNGMRGVYGDFIYPSIEEIKNIEWDGFIVK